MKASKPTTARTVAVKMEMIRSLRLNSVIRDVLLFLSALKR